MDYDPALDEGQMESERAKEILDIELTKVRVYIYYQITEFLK